MSNGSNTALALGLGAGGGVLLWYFLHDKHRGAKGKNERPAVQGDAASTSTTTEAPITAARACALRLDATGLTADGVRVGVADAVKRCKSAGSAEVTIIPNASASAYAELMIGLGRAGIPAYAHRNARGGAARRGAKPARYLAWCGTCYSGARLETNSRRKANEHATSHLRLYPGHDVHVTDRQARRLPSDGDPARGRQGGGDFDLTAFAETVQRLAAGIEAERADDDRARGRFGTRKVFIAAIWRALRRTPYGSLSRADFDALLLRAHRDGLLVLERADLVGAMDPAEVRESEVEHPMIGSRYHFVVDEPGERARNGAHRGFTLRVYPKGHPGAATQRWFRADPPTTWTDARDRLIAAGVIDPALAGRTHEHGGWMLSIDPRDYYDDRAEALPDDGASTRNDSPPASKFTLSIHPRGDEGPKRLRYYVADPPVSWEEARDRLARAGVIDPVMFNRTRYPGGWVMTSYPRFFVDEKAEPLPGGDHGA